MTFQEVAIGNIKLIPKPEPPFYAFCTACRQQYMGPQKWVDLGATYDGGVTEVNGLMITVDDVHLCEGCAACVGKAVGMEFPNEGINAKYEELMKKYRVATGKLAMIEHQAKKDKE